MENYKGAQGDSVDGRSFVKGLIFLFVGGVSMMFALVGIVFGTTIIFAAQAISDINIMSEYKYPYACFDSSHTKKTKYATDETCEGANSTYYWTQDTSATENNPYTNWEDNNERVAEGTNILVNALSLALALLGLIFFILGIKNTGIWKSTSDHM